MDHKYFTNTKNKIAAVPKVSDAIPKKTWNYGLVDKHKSIVANSTVKKTGFTSTQLIGKALAKNNNLFSTSMNKIARAQKQAIKSNVETKYGSTATNFVSYSNPKSFFSSIASGANSNHDFSYNNEAINQEDHASYWSNIRMTKDTPDHNFLNGIDKDWLLIGGLMLCAIIM